MQLGNGRPGVGPLSPVAPWTRIQGASLLGPGLPSESPPHMSSGDGDRDLEYGEQAETHEKFAYPRERSLPPRLAPAQLQLCPPTPLFLDQFRCLRLGCPCPGHTSLGALGPGTLLGDPGTCAGSSPSLLSRSPPARKVSEGKAVTGFYYVSAVPASPK